MKRRILSLLMAGCMLSTLLAGCGSNGNETTQSAGNAPQVDATDSISDLSPAEGVRVVAGSYAEIGNMDPYYTTGSKITWINTVYEMLGSRDGLGGELGLQLAKNVTKIDDVTYDIEIWDIIYDSNGNHITAEDVAFCYSWMKKSGTVSKMGNLDRMEVTGDYTLHMVLTNPAVGVFEDMMQRPIVSKAAYESAGQNMSAVETGTGPYEMAELVSGSSITLRKRDDYWQTDASVLTRMQWANVDELQIKYISSSSQLAIAMQTGEIDGILYMSGTDTAYFVDENGNVEDGYFVHTYADSNTYQIFANMSSASIISSNKELREGIYRAIDPQGILDGVLGGRGTIPHDYGNNKFPDYNAAWDNEDYFDYDPAAAKELIANSGYSGEELTFVTYNMSPYKEMAEVIQAYLAEAGVKISILPIEQTQRDTMFADVNGWDLMMITTTSSDYLVNCYAYLLDANNWGGQTITHYVDDELQALLATAKSVDGHTQENVDAFHYYLVDSAIAYGVVVNNFYSIWREGVDEIYMQRNGYSMPTAFVYSDKWTSVLDQ